MLASSPALLEEYIRQWKQLKAKGFEEGIFDCIDSLDHLPDKPDLEASVRLDRQRYETIPYASTLNSYIQRARTWYMVHGTSGLDGRHHHAHGHLNSRQGCA